MLARDSKSHRCFTGLISTTNTLILLACSSFYPVTATLAAEQVEDEAPPLYLVPRDSWFKPSPQRKKEVEQRKAPAPMRPAIKPAEEPHRTRPTSPEIAAPAPVPKAPEPPPVVVAVESAAPEEPRAFGYGGEYRLAGLVARPTETEDEYAQLLNRLRLKLDYRATPALSFHLQQDFDVVSGSYLNTEQFRDDKAGIDQPRRYWSVERKIREDDSYYASTDMYRGYARLSAEGTDLTFGRQRIALGTGLFWSALDMLNPPNPRRIERDEYLGVDAMLVEQRLGPLSKINLVYAPDPDRQEDRWVGQYRMNVSASDLTFTYGKYWEDNLVGFDIATQIGQAGLRAEWAYADAQVGEGYHKVTLGWDYAFANTLTFSVEGYYSGQTAEDRAASVARHPQMNFVLPFGQAYAGISAGYDLTPLWRASAVVLSNLRDDSRLFYPALAYSLSDNVNVLLGGQFFSGAADSELGGESDLYFTRVQYFF